MDAAVLVLAIILFMTACFLMKSTFHLIWMNMNERDMKRRKFRRRSMLYLIIISIGLFAVSLWTTKPFIHISIISSSEDKADNTIIINGIEYELVPIK